MPSDTPLAPDDAYWLPDGRMVMTATYHLKRGHCCHHGCHHCPYPLPPDGLFDTPALLNDSYCQGLPVHRVEGV